MTITLRQESDARASTKGTSLTFQELDNNFIDILNRTEFTVEGDSGNAQLSSAATADRRLVINGAGGLTTAITSDSTGQAVLTLTQSGGTVAFNDLTDVTITSPSTGQYVAYGPSGWTNGTLSIQNDTSPILGGNLDVNGNSIVTLSNGNITLAPNGTGSIVCSDKTVTQAVLKDYAETVYTGGTTTGTITPDVANGNVQSITLSGNITLNALGSPATGHSMTLIVKQPGSGGPYTLSSTMNFAGGSKTLSTAANAVDIITIFYDGTNYYASLSTNFS